MPSVFQEIKGLGVPFYADHMRSLTEIVDSKLSGLWKERRQFRYIGINVRKYYFGKASICM
jgi:hypothetical protein